MRLRDTSYVVPSDGVNMTKIKGTAKGRIFLSGADGNLYEIQCQTPDEGLATHLGLSRKCRKLNRSSNAFSSVMSIIQLVTSVGSRSALVDLVVDDARNIVWTLSDNGRVYAYDLGKDGEGFKTIGTIPNLLKAATDLPPCAEDSRILSIHVVPATEAAECHLVACSSSGHLFFVFFSSGTVRGARPIGLNSRVICRNPRGTARASAAVGGPAGAPIDSNYHKAYYCQGALLLAEEANSASPDKLVAVAELSSGSLGETTWHRDIGKVRALSEEPMINFSELTEYDQYRFLGFCSSAEKGTNLSLTDFRKDFERGIKPNLLDAPYGATLGEPVHQHFMSRTFLILTNNGIYFGRKNRPIDFVGKLLEGRGDVETFDNLEVLEYVSEYTPHREDRFLPMVALLWAVAVKPSTTATARDKALGILRGFRYKQSSILVIVLSRMLRPFWHKPLLSENEGGEMSFLYPMQPVGEIFESLKNLKGYMKSFFPEFLSEDIIMRDSGTGGGGTFADEPKFIHKMYRLVSRTQQALNLVLAIQEAWQRMSDDQAAKSFMERIKKLEEVKSLRDLVMDAKTSRIVKETIHGFVEPINTNKPELERAEREMLHKIGKGSFFYFNESDERTYEGQKLIKQAEDSGHGQAKNVQDALRAIEMLFEASAGWQSEADIQFNEKHIRKLLEVGRTYKSKRIVEGTVDICFRAAQNFEVTGQPRLGFMSPGARQRYEERPKDWESWELNLYKRKGEMTSDQADSGRTRCYNILISTIRTLLRPEEAAGRGEGDHQRSMAEPLSIWDEQVALMIIHKAIKGTSDQRFHFDLYSCLHEVKPNVLNTIKEKSPHLEEFLKTLAMGDKPNPSFLFSYYKNQNRYGDMLQVLDNLVHSSQIPLPDRLCYLQKSLSICKMSLHQEVARTADASSRLQRLLDTYEIGEVQLRALDRLREILEVEEAKPQPSSTAVGNLKASITDMEMHIVSPTKLYRCITLHHLWWLALELVERCDPYGPHAAGNIQRCWFQIIVGILHNSGYINEMNNQLQVRYKEEMGEVTEAVLLQRFDGVLADIVAYADRLRFNRQQKTLVTFNLRTMSEQLLWVEQMLAAFNPRYQYKSLECLHNVGFRFIELFRNYNDIFVAVSEGVSDLDTKIKKSTYCLEAMEKVLACWLGSTEKNSIDAKQQHQVHNNLGRINQMIQRTAAECRHRDGVDQREVKKIEELLKTLDELRIRFDRV